MRPISALFSSIAWTSTCHSADKVVIGTAFILSLLRCCRETSH